jgi:hypothetical protein
MPPDTSIDRLLRLSPAHLRPEIESLLRRIRLIDPEDSVIQLMLALSLYATYYQTIPHQMAEVAENMGKDNRAHLTALDTRVKTLREMATILQTASDRLEKVPQEIVNRFPTDKVAEQLHLKVELALKNIKLAGLETLIRSLNGEVKKFNESANILQTNSERLKQSAESINQAQLRYVSGGRDTYFFLAGAFFGTLVTSLFGGLYIAYLMSLIHTQGFIGERAAVGIYDGEPVIIISKDQLDGPPLQNKNGDFEIKLKKADSN